MIAHPLRDALDLFVRREFHIKFNLGQIYTRQLDEPIDIRGDVARPFEASSYSAAMMLFHPFKAPPKRRTSPRALARCDKEKRGLCCYTNELGHNFARWR